ncbi:MAG: hypothetical protein RIR01_2020, partial [Bacteroidota bacterium]
MSNSYCKTAAKVIHYFELTMQFKYFELLPIRICIFYNIGPWLRITYLIANIYLQAIKTKSLIGDKVLDAKDNSKFASAVRNRERLKLNKEQIDNLIYQSKLMAEMKKETPSLDLKAHERKLLPTILTDEQYTDLLILLNKKTASDWAANSWNHIKERGIDQGLDSTKVYREIYNYNLAK